VTAFHCSRCSAAQGRRVSHAGECPPATTPRQPPLPTNHPCARPGCGDGISLHYPPFGCSVAFCGCPVFIGDHPRLGDVYRHRHSGEVGTVRLLVPVTGSVRVHVDKPRAAYGSWQAWSVQSCPGDFELLTEGTL